MFSMARREKKSIDLLIMIKLIDLTSELIKKSVVTLVNCTTISISCSHSFLSVAWLKKKKKKKIVLDAAHMSVSVFRNYDDDRNKIIFLCLLFCDTVV